MSSNLYKSGFQKRLYLFVFLGFALLLLFVVSLFAGSDGVKLADIARLYDGSDEIFADVFYSIRLPRALAAVVYGATLAVSGVVMQSVLRNPLASPFTLGVSQSAGFGAAVSIVLFATLETMDPFWAQFRTAVFAFFFSVVAILAILLLAVRVQMRSIAIILAGVAIGSLFASGTMFLQYITDEISAAATLFWTFGDLSRATKESVWFGAMFAVVATSYFWANHWRFDLFALGDEIAFNRGVNVERFRAVALIVATVATASSVSVFGIIGFIGLIAPHMVRLVIGSSHSMLIPASALAGAVLLLLADLMAKFLFYPAQLPVGILTSLIGAPMLLYILLSRRAK